MHPLVVNATRMTYLKAVGCLLIAGLWVLAGIGCVGARTGTADAAQTRKDALKGALGTYAGEPRLSNGHVDVARLIDELTEIRARTYNWLIWHAATDWEDLQVFLPLAAKRDIAVWVTLVPPSESPPNSKAYSEPFRLDYERWSVEIARLSRDHPNLVAWSLDDFSHNQKVFTTERLEAILSAARDVNPRLAFVPCIYYKAATPEFGVKYGPLIDGVLFPFRNESGKANLVDYTSVETEVDRVREVFGGRIPVIVDVYASPHSRLGASTPEYVREVMQRARKSADGVMVYCHQSKEKNPEKWGVVKEDFLTATERRKK
jgi:hypothetical protein